MAIDACVAHFEVEQVEPSTQAKTELVGVRNLQIILDEAQFAPRADRYTVDELLTPLLGQIDRIPRDTGNAWRARRIRIGTDELESPAGEEALCQLLLNEVELRTVIRTAIAAEEHEATFVIELIRKPEPRLECAGECLPFITGRDVVVDVVVRVVQVRIVLRRHGRDLFRVVNVIQERRRTLIIPTHAEVERQTIGDFPIILSVDAELEVLRADPRIGIPYGRAELQAIGDLVVKRQATVGRIVRDQIAEYG